MEILVKKAVTVEVLLEHKAEKQVLSSKLVRSTRR